MKSLAFITALLALQAAPQTQPNQIGEVTLFGEEQPKVQAATKTEIPISKAPSAVTVVTAKQIAESGARTVPDLLRLVAGVNVRWNPMVQTIDIRGFGENPFSNRILLLIDGVPYNSGDTGGLPLSPAFDLFPVQNIKRIEIVRGPGSSLYGENAYWGVINIVTLSGEDLAGGSAQLYGGGQRDTMAGTLMYGNRIGSSGASGLAAIKMQRTMFPTEFWTDDNSHIRANDVFLRQLEGMAGRVLSPRRQPRRLQRIVRRHPRTASRLRLHLGASPQAEREHGRAALQPRAAGREADVRSGPLVGSPLRHALRGLPRRAGESGRLPETGGSRLPGDRRLPPRTEDDPRTRPADRRGVPPSRSRRAQERALARRLDRHRLRQDRALRPGPVRHHPQPRPRDGRRALRPQDRHLAGEDLASRRARRHAERSPRAARRLLHRVPLPELLRALSGFVVHQRQRPDRDLPARRVQPERKPAAGRDPHARSGRRVPVHADAVGPRRCLSLPRLEVHRHLRAAAAGRTQRSRLGKPSLAGNDHRRRGGAPREPARRDRLRELGASKRAPERQRHRLHRRAAGVRLRTEEQGERRRLRGTVQRCARRSRAVLAQPVRRPALPVPAALELHRPDHPSVSELHAPQRTRQLRPERRQHEAAGSPQHHRPEPAEQTSGGDVPRRRDGADRP